MADHVQNHQVRRPRQRVVPGDALQSGLFYPGEVARMEDFAGIDYRQLRRLFKLVREQANAPIGPERTWSRYTLRDIAALKIAVALCRSDVDPDSRYLVIAPLERACAALRTQGVANPLLDVPLTREGRVIFAEIDGARIDPTNGQMQLRDAHDEVLAYLERSDITVSAAERSAARKALRAEVRRKPARPSLSTGRIKI